MGKARKAEAAMLEGAIRSEVEEFLTQLKNTGIQAGQYLNRTAQRLVRTASPSDLDDHLRGMRFDTIIVDDPYEP